LHVITALKKCFSLYCRVCICSSVSQCRKCHNSWLYQQVLLFKAKTKLYKWRMLRSWYWFWTSTDLCRLESDLI